MSMFAPRTFRSAEPWPDERQRPRNPLDLPVFVLRPGEGRVPAAMLDICARGCRIVVAMQVRAGAYVGVEVPGGTRYSGWVVWQTRGSFGLDFASLIPDGELAQMMRLHDRSA